MFGRKAKSTPEQSAALRRQVHRGTTSPAFSYYTSRLPERNTDRKPQEKRREPQKTQQPLDQLNTQPVQPAGRGLIASIPFWLLLIVIVACTFKVLSLSTDPKIIIVGKTSTSSSYVKSITTYEIAAQKLLASSATNRSKLTIDTQGVAASLKQEFPELEDVSVSVPLINSRPLVYIQPADPSLVLQAAQGNFAINHTGLVLTQLQSLPSGIPEVVDQSGLTPEPGKQVLPSGTVSFVGTVSYQFAAAHLAISAFVLPASSPYELDVRLEGKPYVLRFNLETPALTQSGAAIATIQQLGSTTPSSYIDLRVPGRVYYK